MVYHFDFGVDYVFGVVVDFGSSFFETVSEYFLDMVVTQTEMLG